MRLPVVRFTIRSLMIVVAIMAALLALPDGWREVAAVVSLPCLALFTAWRLLLGGHRRLAAIGFWSLSILANVLFAALCVFPESSRVALFLLWFFILLPTIAGFGATWAILVTRGVVVTRYSRQAVWILVITLAVMPGVTAWSAWPFRLVFLTTARSTMECLADQGCSRAGHLVSSMGGPVPVSSFGDRYQDGRHCLMERPDPSYSQGILFSSPRIRPS